MTTVDEIITQLDSIDSVYQIREDGLRVLAAVHNLSPTIKSDLPKIRALIAQYPEALKVFYFDERPTFRLQ